MDLWVWSKAKVNILLSETFQISVDAKDLTDAVTPLSGDLSVLHCVSR